MSKTGCWIEAMRLRTLPVSLAGVIYAGALGVLSWRFDVIPWGMCVAFALLAQVASNFANEYYDFKAGLDKAGRVGPRRGVTEGDITPEAMKYATFGTLGVACLIGVALVAMYGQWWMYVAGVATALGVIAYSAGPYPLSRHGLGEVAVVFFFGIVPVVLTYMLMGGPFGWWLLAAAVGLGLMGANVLVVNNYRDMDDDRAVGKRTLAVVIGRRGMSSLYLANGFMAVMLTLPEWVAAARMGWLCPCVYLILHVALYTRLVRSRGEALNPLLGMTACLMMLYAVMFTLVVCMV
ncbi:1,4-dihydroxy-2-naphthoate octaprenyltransferase [uncultured Duncaniella sp.]|uniref:1,4-dihydroxy-2-naphthoate octaprenyltransferase n=1 Tax=uncultured Duncaniella sp. TaxID=2768039 RepID=UPI0026DF4FD8|nr:1,4-dihydroxy-2-naphthoate octaprenyltransferase [uncultured Duncaniella sp.]